MKNKFLIRFITIYKLIINLIRITTGILIFYFKGNIDNLLMFLFSEKVIEDPNDLLYNYLSYHITNPSAKLALLLASVLVLFSIFEFFLTIGLFYKSKKSATGLFIITLLWIPFEILFVSRFLFINKGLTILLDIIILLALYEIIKRFNRHNKENLNK